MSYDAFLEKLKVALIGIVQEKIGRPMTDLEIARLREISTSGMMVEAIEMEVSHERTTVEAVVEMFAPKKS